MLMKGAWMNKRTYRRRKGGASFFWRLLFFVCHRVLHFVTSGVRKEIVVKERAQPTRRHGIQLPKYFFKETLIYLLHWACQGWCNGTDKTKTISWILIVNIASLYVFRSQGTNVGLVAGFQYELESSNHSSNTTLLQGLTRLSSLRRTKK